MEFKQSAIREDFYLFEFLEGDVSMSHAKLWIKNINLGSAVFKAGLICSVGTSPECRRGGYVKRLLGKMYSFCRERGVDICLLHPFSNSYYRKYGFERVSDHRILSFPMSVLSCVERYPELVRCNAKERNADLCRVYNSFSKGRNIMPLRDESYAFVTKDDKKRVYISYGEKGEADGYIIYSVEAEFDVNRMARGVLNVYELGYTCPEAMKKILGFMRMFDGEAETAVLHNVAMMPELELFLRDYEMICIRVVPDCMARINNVKAVLENIKYPEPLSFSVRVTDPFPAEGAEGLSCGSWRVDFDGSQTVVTELGAEDGVDVELDIPSLSRFVFGYEVYSRQVAQYCHNTKFLTDAEGFFKAFKNTPCGVFEHF